MCNTVLKVQEKGSIVCYLITEHSCIEQGKIITDKNANFTICDIFLYLKYDRLK